MDGQRFCRAIVAHGEVRVRLSSRPRDAQGVADGLGVLVPVLQRGADSFGLGLSNATSPYYPQSNGKLERFHGSIKGECLRPGTPISLEDAVRIVGRYVGHYNEVRLHSAIGYVAPADKLAGREAEIFAARDRKLVEARERRKEQREVARLRTVA